MNRVAAYSGMRAMADNRFLGRIRLRAWRRALVVGTAGFWILALAGWFTPAHIIPGWVAVAAAVIVLAASVLLVLATRNLTASVDAFTDERDRAVRDSVHRKAYWALGAPFGALSGLTASIVSRRVEDGHATLSMGEVSVIAAGGVTLLLLFVFLPTYILAWMEFDPLPSDEEDQ